MFGTALSIPPPTAGCNRFFPTVFRVHSVASSIPEISPLLSRSTRVGEDKSIVVQRRYTTDSLSILVGTKEFGFSAYGLLGPPSCLLSFTFNLLFSLDLTEG
ncbi:hypothetical protein L1887_12448 [Cichorium endivia]|nr:hypothetical protein L1887_12448 [Cichorium endivia]